MRSKWIIISCLLLFILAGCGGKRESERMFYVYGLGIDYQDDEYIAHVQIINFSNVAKSEEPRSDIEQFEIVTAKGKSFDQAVYRLYRSVDEYIYWGNLTYLVVTEEALKQGKLDSIMDVTVRFIDTRYQVLVYSTNGDVKEILLTTPIIHSSAILSKLGDPENTFAQNSFVEEVSIRELIIGLKEPSHEKGVPSISLVENRETAKGKRKAITFEGVGIITPSGFKGTIKGDAALGLKWMNKNTENGSITLNYEPNNPSTMAEILINNVRVKIKPLVNQKQVTFDIQVKVDAFVDSINSPVNAKKLEKRIEEEVKKEIIKTYEAALAMDTDIFRLSEQVYRKELATWKQLEENGKVPLSKDSIQNLKVKVSKLKLGKKQLTPTINIE